MTEYAASPVVVASLRRRFVASLIDGVLLLLVWVPIAITFGSSSTETRVILGIFGALYSIGFLTLMSATPGKRGVGIFVAYPDGTPIHLKRVSVFQTASIRYFVGGGVSYLGLISPTLGIVTTLLPLASFILALSDERRRTIHDRVAGTLVLRGSPTKDAPMSMAAEQEP